MPDDVSKPLARCIYEAHARSRRLKTGWVILSRDEQQHWVNVATAVLSFLGEYEEMFEDGVSPDAGVFGG